ncbi:MAG: hypothetical protein FLDDKLPJ_00864 [Phycisphaerae bacterium]|nr:hypothetical protein [Phycisphaerae bacterium]
MRGFSATSLVAAFCVVGGAADAQPRERTIRVFTDGNTIWLAQTDVKDGGRSTLRFGVAAVHAGGWGGVEPYNVTPMQGRIAVAAAVGDRLHVIFDDGSHASLAVGREVGFSRSGVARLLPQPPSPHRRIGGGALPLLLASDRVQDTVYAIVDAKTVRSLVEGVEDDHGGLKADGELIEHASDRFVLLRYAFRGWEIDRVLPADIGPEDRLEALAARDGRCAVYYRKRERGALVEALSGVSGNDAWSVNDVGGDPVACEVRSARLEADRRILLCSESRGGAVPGLFMLTNSGEGWGQRLDLQTPGPREDAVLGDVALGDPGALGIYVDAAGALHTVGWDLATGKAAAGTQRVRAFEPGRSPGWRAELTRVLGLIVFPALMMIVLYARRGAVLAPATPASGTALAPASARVAAFLIDAALLAPVNAVLAYALLELPAAGVALPELIDVLGSARPLPVEMFGTVAACVAAYCVYSAAFEAGSGATPGKRLLGLRVVRVDGSRCGPGPALVRNALRVVDVIFAPALLLTVMTVNRQRLGDILAGTIVVAALTAMPPANPAESRRGPDDPGASS